MTVIGKEINIEKKFQTVVQTPDYGRFVVEPLERGFGDTLGNALRRVLLSSLEGAAITWVKIEGTDPNSTGPEVKTYTIPHEYSTIKGVKEDVLKIILNLKKVRIRMNTSEPVTIFLSHQGKGEIKAGDFRCPPNVDIVNPDLVIATATSDDALVRIEAGVTKGKGYVPMEHMMNIYQGEVGKIILDAYFSPVLKVNYMVERARVLHRTDFDRLTIEIWTDGTITPVEALREAAKIIRDSLGVFLEGVEPLSSLSVSSEKRESESKEGILSWDIKILELSSRAYNSLKRMRINTIGDLIKYSEEDLLNLKNLGKKSVNEIKEKLAAFGLSLREKD